MEVNEHLREQIFQIIENQMQENNPPATKATFERLKKEGYSKFEAKQLIGQCLAIELFDTIKHGKPYDEARYIKNLNNLPQSPF